MRSGLIRGGIGLVACAVALAAAFGVRAQAAPAAGQTVLGPGLYVFQTRTRDATCGDSEKDGYVLSYFAAVHGVPHSLEMRMELTNTPHFKEWTLKVSGNTIHGESRIGSAPDGPETHIDMKLEGDRFKGTGARTYNGTLNGKKVRCQVNYDTLLRRLD